MSKITVNAIVVEVDQFLRTANYETEYGVRSDIHEQIAERIGAGQRYELTCIGSVEPWSMNGAGSMSWVMSWGEPVTAPAPEPAGDANPQWSGEANETWLTEDERRIKKLGIGGFVTKWEQHNLFTTIADLRAEHARLVARVNNLRRALRDVHQLSDFNSDIGRLAGEAIETDNAASQPAQE